MEYTPEMFDTMRSTFIKAMKFSYKKMSNSNEFDSRSLNILKECIRRIYENEDEYMTYGLVAIQLHKHLNISYVKDCSSKYDIKHRVLNTFSSYYFRYFPDITSTDNVEKVILQNMFRQFTILVQDRLIETNKIEYVD